MTTQQTVSTQATGRAAAGSSGRVIAGRSGRACVFAPAVNPPPPGEKQGLPSDYHDGLWGLVLQQRLAPDASLTCRYVNGLADRAASGNSLNSTFPPGCPGTLL